MLFVQSYFLRWKHEPNHSMFLKGALRAILVLMSNWTGRTHSSLVYHFSFTEQFCCFDQPPYYPMLQLFKLICSKHFQCFETSRRFLKWFQVPQQLFAGSYSWRSSLFYFHSGFFGDLGNDLMWWKEFDVGMSPVCRNNRWNRKEKNKTVQVSEEFCTDIF